MFESLAASEFTPEMSLNMNFIQIPSNLKVAVNPSMRTCCNNIIEEKTICKLDRLYVAWCESGGIASFSCVDELPTYILACLLRSSAIDRSSRSTSRSAAVGLCADWIQSAQSPTAAALSPRLPYFAACDGPAKQPRVPRDQRNCMHQVSTSWGRRISAYT